MIGLPEVAAGVMLMVLNAYVLTGGADFGGGVWDLLASGPGRDRQRGLIAAAIAPIWEANHVWLVIAVVMCFTAFPPVFATFGTVLHVPLALVLVGIVCRGAAFVFRSSGTQSEAARWAWGRTFAIASSITPLLLGVVVGAVSTGAVGAAQRQVGRAGFLEVYVQPWLAPFPLSVGLLTVTLFALLAAVYLTLAAPDPGLRESFRRRALGAALAAVVAGGISIALSHDATSMLRGGLGIFPVTGGAAAVLTIWCLWTRRFGLARVAAAAQVSLVLWGWAASMYPYLVPETITVQSGAAPAGTLEALLWIVAAGAVILIPSLLYLVRLFAKRVTPIQVEAQARTGPDEEPR